MSGNSEIEKLELTLRYNFGYVEADFVLLRRTSSGSLFNYAETLRMELDTLRNLENANRKRNSPKRHA